MPTHGEIHTIAGGFSGGGCTASQRKKYARSVMTVDMFEDHSPDVDIRSQSKISGTLYLMKTIL